MIRMFVRHEVENFGTWKQAQDAFDEERRGLGVIAQGVFQTHDQPNDVTAWHDFESLDCAQSFAASDRLKSVMSEAGVSSPPQIWFTTPA